MIKRTILLCLGLTLAIGCKPEAIANIPPSQEMTEPNPEVLRLARLAYACEKEKRAFADSTIAIIDYSLASTERRLWVMNADSGDILLQELVAHGRNSGQDLAERFSNISGSKQTSLGSFRTAETYRGKHGYSLRLDGLESGFNDKARSRAIVIHGADYVSREFANKHGRLGRSWGCPALPQSSHRTIIDAIKGSRFLFAYGNDESWLANSKSLHCDLD